MNNKLIYFFVTTLYFTILDLFITASFKFIYADSPSGNNDQCIIVSELLITEGTVGIKRSGELEYQSISDNKQLCQYHLIRPSIGVSAELQCLEKESSSRKVRLIADLLVGAGYACEPISRFNACTDGGCREGERDPLIPLIISEGRFLDTKPNLRWLPVRNANHYIVTLSGNGVNWRDRVQGNEINYNGEPLKLGGSYLITVESVNDENLVFQDKTIITIISEKDYKSFQNSYDQIIAKGLENTAEKLEIAKMYIKYNLRFEAIERLKELAQDVDPEKKISIYNEISKLYNGMGLPTFEYSYKIEAQELEAIGTNSQPLSGKI